MALDKNSPIWRMYQALIGCNWEQGDPLSTLSETEAKYMVLVLLKFQDHVTRKAVTDRRGLLRAIKEDLTEIMTSLNALEE